MRECMATDKPLITIVMAVYKPNEKWLCEQLDSLDLQTYPNLELLVCDDCPEHPVDEKFFSEHITKFPYRLFRNEKNLGSNLTFQRLTELAEGELISYCDQDDVWLPEKLSVLAEELERTGSLLVCSDMYIIDGEGNQTADSITKVRRHHHFFSGEGLADDLVFNNWVTGCAMLVRRECAKSAVPFCPEMVHDQYIALCCAAQGRIHTVMRPLIRYRIHGSNQTGVMSGVNSRSDYVEIRIKRVRKRLDWLRENFPFATAISGTLSDGVKWVDARISNMTQRKGASTVWKYRRFGKMVSLFEVFSTLMPEKVFMFFVKLVRLNKL